MGRITDRYFSWALHRVEQADYKLPKSETCLTATTEVVLEADNEFGVPAGKVLVQTTYDAETGDRLADYLSHDPYGGSVFLLRRVYDAETGKMVKEERAKPFPDQ